MDDLEVPDSFGKPSYRFMFFFNVVCHVFLLSAKLTGFYRTSPFLGGK